MPSKTVPLHVRWSDVDAYGHVNNVAIVGLLEQARVLALWSDAEPWLPPLHASAEVWVLVAGVEVRYLRPIAHRTEPITAHVGVEKVAGASFVLSYTLEADGITCVRASTTMALVDARSGAPVRIDPQLKAQLLTLA